MAQNQDLLGEERRQHFNSNSKSNGKSQSSNQLTNKNRDEKNGKVAKPAGDKEVHKPKSARGFASMDPERQREIARKGGRSVPPEKRSFSQDPKLAAEAGRKGGENVPPEKRSFSQDRDLAAEAGRKGGEASGSKRSEASQ